MPPIIIAAGIATAGGIASSIISGKKAKKATIKSAEIAAATQEKALETSVDLNEPFRQAGLGALDLLNQIFVQGDTGQLEELPGISFLREQGEQAIGRAQSARGNFLSGAGVKEAIRFNQGLASTNLAQATDPLFDLANIGQAAAAGVGNQAVQTGRGVAQTQLIAGQARANQAVNIGSSINTGLNNFLFTALAGGAFDQSKVKPIDLSPFRPRQSVPAPGAFGGIFG